MSVRSWLLTLLLLFVGGCASTEIPRESRDHLHQHLLERKYFVATAPRIDSATLSNGNITVHGELGTNFTVASAAPISGDGFLLTARHVVHAAGRDPAIKPWIIAFEHGNPRVVESTVVWTATRSDVALLKADLRDVKFFAWSHPHGEIPRGTPLAQGGLKSHLAAGKIRSAALLDQPGSDSVYIQHTVPARPGDSGAPLVDEAGNLVAIITRRLYFALGSEGTGLGGGEAARPNMDLLNEQMEAYRKSLSLPGK